MYDSILFIYVFVHLFICYTENYFCMLDKCGTIDLLLLHLYICVYIHDCMLVVMTDAWFHLDMSMHMCGNQRMISCVVLLFSTYVLKKKGRLLEPRTR